MRAHKSKDIELSDAEMRSAAGTSEGAPSTDLSCDNQGCRGRSLEVSDVGAAGAVDETCCTMTVTRVVKEKLSMSDADADGCC